MFTPTWGFMIQFDEQKFQTGWFNHEPVLCVGNLNLQSFLSRHITHCFPGARGRYTGPRPWKSYTSTRGPIFLEDPFGSIPSYVCYIYLHLPYKSTKCRWIYQSHGCYGYGIRYSKYISPVDPSWRILTFKIVFHRIERSSWWVWMQLGRLPSLDNHKKQRVGGFRVVVNNRDHELRLTYICFLRGMKFYIIHHVSRIVQVCNLHLSLEYPGRGVLPHDTNPECSSSIFLFWKKSNQSFQEMKIGA